MKKGLNTYRLPALVIGASLVWACAMLGTPGSLQAQTIDELDQTLSSRSTGFFREFYDTVLYESVAPLLRFDQLFETLTFRKTPALDVNVFDEVPDSGFFENRHGRTRLSRDALVKGPATGNGPNPAGPWTVFKGKFEGTSVGFFIKDQDGEKYLLKFDPRDNPEMASGSEIIAHKFFHAFGYHVAEYYLVRFNPDILKSSAEATYYDKNGFKKPLDSGALQSLVAKIPIMKGGVLRASASKLLPKPLKGYMDFDGRRSQDPLDLIRHEDRRSIRALRVFGSWLSHYDLREGNTLDVIVDGPEGAYVKHYLIDFGSSFGSAAYHAKVPVAGFEHVVDWYAIGADVVNYKITRNPWERQWDELGQEVTRPSLGYFDNMEFDPGRWKTQLHYDVFKRVTVGDAFWASKIIMAFTDDEIHALVATGEYSLADDEQFLADMLIVRRDLVANYWFSRVTPLDAIQLFQVGNGYELRFEDLSVKYGFESAGGTQYRYRVTGMKKGTTTARSIPLDPNSFEGKGAVTVKIRVKRGGDGAWNKPPVEIKLAKHGDSDVYRIVKIDHGT